MSARKAERLAVKELVRTDRTWTLDNVFEYGREDPSAGKRGHPAAQQNPVTPDREKRRDHDTNDRHREGRAQNANCRKDLVTQVCCVTPEKTKSGDVKLCQRIVMENILRYTPKQPETGHANEQANGQMEAEIFAASKPSGDENPKSGISFANSPQTSRGQHLLLNSICPLPD